MRWIVGDVHGMLGPLRVMVDEVRKADKEAVFYFAGDYCDRGPDTKGVVDLLLEMTAAGEAFCVRGNHDDVFDLCLNGHTFATGPDTGGSVDTPDVVEIVRLFWREGLLETMSSYGVDLSEASEHSGGSTEKYYAWVLEQFQQVPKPHRDFFRNLPGVVEADDFFVVHALWEPDEPDPAGKLAKRLEADDYLRYEAIWGRYDARKIRADKRWKRRCYVGHTPTDTYVGHDDLMSDWGQVIVADQLTLVDTACFSPSGRLSAACHDDGRVVQVHHTGEVLT